jgi:DNA-binding transcriptional ArsR family regulator
MADDLDAVFRALADPTRRRILDLLKPGPATTGALCAQFPELSRFAVMKHLGILEEAGLVLARRDGRQRWNYLNAVPIRQVYERWMGPFAELWSSSLLRLKDYVELGISAREPRPEEPPRALVLPQEQAQPDARRGPGENGRPKGRGKSGTRSRKRES